MLPERHGKNAADAVEYEKPFRVRLEGRGQNTAKSAAIKVQHGMPDAHSSDSALHNLNMD